MRHATLSLVLIASMIAFTSATATAQTKIESKADYTATRNAITALSQKLYEYSKMYPAYSFAAEYNEAGKLSGMTVKGVADKQDAEHISTYLLELETLGELVRNMDGAHLPEATENTMKTKLTEAEAKQHIPTFDSEAMTSAK